MLPLALVTNCKVLVHESVYQLAEFPFPHDHLSSAVVKPGVVTHVLNPSTLQTHRQISEFNTKIPCLEKPIIIIITTTIANYFDPC